MADAYETDARQLQYVSPTGKLFTPHFQVIPYEVDRKNKEFEFIDIPGTYIQDLGMSSGTFALKIYFVGSTHHRYANAFLKALSEYGVAKLVLPLDDVEFRTVIPTNIKKESDFIDGINQTVFEVRFKETIETFKFNGEPDPGSFGEGGELVYPPPPPEAIELPPAKPKPTLASKLQAAIDSKKEAFASKLTGLGNRTGSINLVKSLASRVKTTLNFAGELRDAAGVITGEIQQVTSAIQDAQTFAIATFDGLVSSIDSAANAMFESPLILATQIQSVLAYPNFPLVTNLLDNYESFLSDVQRAPRVYTAGTSDYLQVQTLYGTAAVTAVASKILDADYQTRQEAVEAFRRVKTMYDNLMAYLEAQEAATSELALNLRFEVDSEVCETLHELIQRVSGSVDDILIGLRQTVTLTAEFPTTPINLVAEHYPTLWRQAPHAALTLFERTNSLSGDEIFLLDRGREYKVLI